MSSVLLTLRAGGEGFIVPSQFDERPVEGVGGGGRGGGGGPRLEVSKETGELLRAASRCKGHGQVLDFLDAHEGELERLNKLTVTGLTGQLYHEWNREYAHHAEGEASFHPCDFYSMRAFVEQRIVDTDPKIAQVDKLAHLIFSKPLDKIAGLLRMARVQISNWGVREVTFRGYEGSIALDRIAIELRRLAERRWQQDAASREGEGILYLGERVSGIEAVEVTKLLYNLSDRQVAELGWITWILLSIRELFSSFSANRGEIDCQTPGSGVRSIFCKFKSDYFTAFFGKEQPEVERTMQREKYSFASRKQLKAGVIRAREFQKAEEGRLAGAEGDRA